MIRLVAATSLAALFAALAAAFAAQQSLWVDETTQLTGLAMPFADHLAWLTGAARPETGVPPDRMPPLSYWLGALWAGAFGLSEHTMRLFGIACAATAVPALWLSGARLAGAAGGAFAVVAVMFSANALVAASAIRAYPLFLALSAWAVWAYLRAALDGPSRGRLAVLAAILVAASYTHFYGLVAAFALFGSLVLIGFARGRGAAGAIAAGLATAVLAAGLLPFVTAAAGVQAPGHPPDPRAIAAGAARLAFRLVAHPAHQAAAGLLPAHLTLTAACAAASAWTARRAPATLAALALPLVLGFAALGAAAMAAPAFDVFAPHYNLWMLPFPALLVTLALRGGALPAALAVGVGAATLWSAATLIRHAGLYANGPGDWASARLAAEGTLAIHDADGPWGAVYFPLYWRTAGAAEQWLAGRDGSLSRITPEGLVPIPDVSAARAGFATVALVRSFALDARTLGRIARGEIACAEAAAPPMAEGRTEHVCAFLGATLTRAAP